MQKCRKFKILVEWCRRVHIDKSIKSKVIQMIHKEHKKSRRSIINMDKAQLEQYFDRFRDNGLEKLHIEISDLKSERDYYILFIKKETQNLREILDIKYPLKLKLETKTFFDTKISKFDNSTFKSARKVMCLTPEKRSRKDSGRIKPWTNYNELLKSQDDMKKFNVEKELIHRSLHNFRANSSYSNYSPHSSKPPRQNNTHQSPMSGRIKPFDTNLYQSQNLSNQKSVPRLPSPLTTLPKPLLSRTLTPRNAPNDLFRRLESKIKDSRPSTTSNESGIMNLHAHQHQHYDPIVKIHSHIKMLISSMRALSSTPSSYFRKSYFFTNPQVDLKQSVNSLADVLREGRRANPQVTAAQLFDNVHGCKVVSSCFTRWKVAFIQNWVCKEARLLQRYKLGRKVMQAMRDRVRSRKYAVDEFNVKQELLSKVRVLKAWKAVKLAPVRSFVTRRVVRAWRIVVVEAKEEKLKIKEALTFRDRLLKQKVMYILYKFTQCHLIPKKNYHRSLKTRAMFSMITYHKKVQAISKIIKIHFSQQKLYESQKFEMLEKFHVWKEWHFNSKNEEREMDMLNVALRFRLHKL